jgi:hypothetical protein
VSPGQSQSNLKSRESARKIILAYRRSEHLPDDLAWKEIEDDGLKQLTTAMCFWLAERGIPSMGFDENLQPIHPGNNRCLLPNTLAQYLGYWLLDVRQMFPGHEDFRESLDDNSGMTPTTPWWSHMRAGFIKAATKFQMSLEEDVVFGTDTLHPLYKDNGKPIGDVITNPVSNIDVIDTHLTFDSIQCVFHCL